MIRIGSASDDLHPCASPRQRAAAALRATSLRRAGVWLAARALALLARPVGSSCSRGVASTCSLSFGTSPTAMSKISFERSTESRGRFGRVGGSAGSRGLFLNQIALRDENERERRKRHGRQILCKQVGGHEFPSGPSVLLNSAAYQGPPADNGRQ